MDSINQTIAPVISLITPMYNVEDYLPQFFDSVEAQSHKDQIELILVDDGSTDNTNAIATAFVEHTTIRATLIHKENGGQATARNTGIKNATGTWITFPDPDDILGDEYISAIIDLVTRRENSHLSMITTRMILWWEATNRITAHALDYRFTRGDKLVSLDDEPTYVQAHVTTGFFRRDLVIGNQLQFRADLRYRFEDGNFVSHYLLLFDDPIVAMSTSAVYFYRQRMDQSSTVQSSRLNTEKYEAPLRIGYPDVLNAAIAKKGLVPTWIQNLVLYDQFWISRSSQTSDVRQVAWPPDFPPRIIAQLRNILSYIDDDLIITSQLVPVPRWMRSAFLLFKHGSDHSRPEVKGFDHSRGLTQITYIYSGDQPTETVEVHGRTVSARFEKTYFLEYVGTPIAYLRTLWIALHEPFSLLLNGEIQEIIPYGSEPPARRVTQQQLGRMQPEHKSPTKLPTLPAKLNGVKPDKQLIQGSIKAGPPASGTSLNARLSRARARGIIATAKLVIRRKTLASALRSSRKRAQFRNAWLFMDRDDDANDSAEDLYRWVREHKPHVNAWFVIRRQSRDWHRLKRDGFRLIEYGSNLHAAALVNAVHLASSHADRFVTHPFPRAKLIVGYSFTFLQHGVIKGDISGWLNRKSISTFITSTTAEYEYVSGPGPFKFSRREVRLAGLPRFDALLRLAGDNSAARRDAVIIMPTWRDYLVGGMMSSSRDRQPVEDFDATDFAKYWNAFLRSEDLRAAAREAECEIVFMPHPNMAHYLDRFSLGTGVHVCSYDDADVRELFARAAVLVTDYSSTAFNMGFLGRPVVYFQFDRDQYYAGHTERPGYFSYERDGFGPVVGSVSDAVQATMRALSGAEPSVYAHRRDSAFPVRDGRNCERVFNAMVQSRTPVSDRECGRKAVSDDWTTLTALRGS